MPDKLSQEKTTYIISSLPNGDLNRPWFNKGNFKYWVFIIPFIGLYVGFIVNDSETKKNIASNLFAVLILLTLVIGLIKTLISVIRRWLYRRAVRAFAQINNLQPLENVEMSSCIPPCIKEDGAHNVKLNGYSFDVTEPAVRLFDYSYSVGQGKSRTDYQFAVAAVPLIKDYPHIFLDGKANGRDYDYAGSQKIDLEGDFNKYFQLYIPKGSAAGALTMLSPDVMQVLIDLAKPFDIEIKGNVAAIITPGLAFTKENIQALLEASTTLKKEFDELANSWRPVYTPGGEPFVLKKNWQAAIAVIIFLALYFLSYFVLNYLRGGRH